MIQFRRLRASHVVAGLVALVVFAAYGTGVADAQTSYTWTGGANRTWNTSSTNWTTGAGNIAWTGTNNAVFGSTSPGSVTVSGSQAVTGISFTGTGFTLSSGTLWLASATTSITANQNATIGSVVAGANALLANGSATLTLTGANTYSSTTTVSSGTLQIGNGGTAGSLGTGNVTNNAALVFNRSNALTVSNTIAGNGSVSQIGSGTLTLTGSNAYTGTTTVMLGTLQIGNNGTTGVISGSSALVLGGASLIMSRSGTVTQSFNGTTLSTGASVASAVNASNTVNFGAITRNAGATLDLATTGTFITSSANTNGILGGWATVGGANWAVANGASAITALSAYTNDTWASGNNTTVTTSAAVGASATTNSLRFNVAAATSLTLSGTATVASGGILVTPTVGNNASTIIGGTLLGSSGGELIVVQSNTANSLTVSSVIANNGSTTGLTKSGAGTLVLTAANTYTGTTAINGGTFQIGTGGATGSISVSSPITGSGGGTLAFNRSDTLTQGTDYAAFGGGVNVSQIGSGTLVFGTNNTAFSGTTTIASGVVRVTSSTNTLGAGSLGNLVLNGGTLDMALTGTQTPAWTITVGQNGGTLLLSNANTTMNGYATIGGAGTLTFKGGATGVGFRTSTATTFTGKVVVDNAQVLYPFTPASGDDAVTITNNAALAPVAQGGQTFGSASKGITIGSGTNRLETLNGGTTPIASKIVGADGSSAIRFGGANATSTGTAFIILSNTANSYASKTEITQTNYGSQTTSTGGLRLGASEVIPNGVGKGNVAIFNVSLPATLDMNGFSETINGLSSLNPTTGTYSADSVVDNLLASSTSTLTLGDNDATAIFAGSIRNTVAGAILNLTKIGSGTQTLSGSNTFSGTTSINAGTLQVGTGGTTGLLSSATVITGSSGGTLAFSRTDAYGGNVANTISGGMGVAQLGSGTLTLTGANSFSGGISVSLGRLVAGNANALGSGTATVSGGVLDVGSYALSVAGFTITSGSLVGSGTLTATNGYALQGGAVNAILGSGAITVSNGTTTLGAPGRFNSASGLTISSGRLTLGGNETVSSFMLTGGILAGTGITLTSTTNYDVRSGSVLANFGGSAGLIKSTAGTVTLSGNSSYSGGTDVSAGTLLVNGALGGAVNVNNGATLGGSGTVTGLVTVFVGGTLSPGNSPGELTVGSLALNATSTTLMEINDIVRGTSYDGITITGSNGLTYGGVLSLVFGNGSAFTDNTSFNLFSFTGSPAGGFSSVTSSGFYAGTWTNNNDGTFNLQKDSQTLTFTQATGAVVVVPEPGAFVIAGVGMILAGWKLARRR